MKEPIFKRQWITFIFFLLILIVGCREEGGQVITSGPLPFSLLNPIPEGEKILFDYRKGSTIRSMRPDGSETLDIMWVYSTYGAQSSLSPDGRKLVFSVRDPAGDVKVQEGERHIDFDLNFKHLWIREGSQVRQLTGRTNKNVSDGGDSWSPDGKTIFFTHRGNIRMEGVEILKDDIEIWAIEADGSNARKITNGRASDISPDGKTLVFSEVSEDIFSHAYLVDSDGLNRRLIRRNAYGCKWRPNGIHLACLDLETRHLILIDKDGVLLSVLTEGMDLSQFRISYYNHAWSPDGLQIAFAGDVKGEDGDSIWKLSVDGNFKTVRLTPKGEHNTHPQWAP